MVSNRKIVLYIATSLDGYIAREDGDIDWLSMVESKNEDYGYKDFLKSIDTVIMGRRTYVATRSRITNCKNMLPPPFGAIPL